MSVGFTRKGRGGECSESHGEPGGTLTFLIALDCTLKAFSVPVLEQRLCVTQKLEGLGNGRDLANIRQNALRA